MGQKADNLNRELVPTRSLLRWLADRIGVSIEDDITSVADQVRYQHMLEQALAGCPTREEPPSPVDEVLAGGGALVPRPDVRSESTDDMDMVDRISKIIGVGVDGTRRDKLEAVHEALERIVGGGGDVEVPKGDSLAEAMKFGHDQNHQLRDRLRDADMLIQRIAASLQVTRVKDGDGSEVLEAVQLFESAKLSMRRRILELRATGFADAQPIAATQAADELEVQYTRMLSPTEQADWTRAKGRTPHLSGPLPEHPPHPFRFTRDDLSRLADMLALLAHDAMISSQEMTRRSALADLMKEIHSSPNGSAHVLACMEATLVVLSRERAARLKE